ncbi:MAG: hypothetical protein ACI9N1_001289 [Flavobacteriales bacterium]|jgi:hypothetical protein
MSKIEKIAFIQSFWSLFSVKGKLQFCTEVQLDSIISNIHRKIDNHKKINALMHVHRMPVYLN